MGRTKSGETNRLAGAKDNDERKLYVEVGTHFSTTFRYAG